MFNFLETFSFQKNHYVVTVDNLGDDYVDIQLLNLTTQCRFFGKIQRGFGLKLYKVKGQSSVLSYSRDSEFFKLVYNSTKTLYRIINRNRKGVK